jgi:hypothetical protein
MTRSLVTGASGSIGRRLLAALDDVVVTSRSARRGAIGWDPAHERIDPRALDGIEEVFHLAGEPVAEGRWSRDKKDRIRASRVNGTRHLVESLARLERKPRVLVSASAVGIYGDRGDEILDERSRDGSGFLAEVCRGWEAEAMKAEELGVRVVCARIGIVLSPDGGAMPKMLPAFRAGVSGRLASGAQWMPWVHVDDVVGLLVAAARDDRWRGPINVVAPDPVTNAGFTTALARAVRRPAILPIPRAALRLIFGELAGVVLASQRVVPKSALEHGYEFRYGELTSAIGQVIAEMAA